MVAVLFIAGDHVPVIPLFEVVGKAANEQPEHIGATCVNDGVRKGLTEEQRKDIELKAKGFVEFAKFSQRKYTEKPSRLVKQGGFFDL